MEKIYLAIHENEERTVYVEYIPSVIPGTIEIVSVHIEPRLVSTLFEGRRRRGYHIRPQINSDPRDEA